MIFKEHIELRLESEFDLWGESLLRPEQFDYCDMIEELNQKKKGFHTSRKNSLRHERAK